MSDSVTLNFHCGTGWRTTLALTLTAAALLVFGISSISSTATAAVSLYHWDSDILGAYSAASNVEKIKLPTSKRDIVTYCDYMLSKLFIGDKTADVFGVSNAWVDPLTIGEFADLGIDVALIDKRLAKACTHGGKLKCVAQRMQRQIMVYDARVVAPQPMQPTLEHFENLLRTTSEACNGPAMYIPIGKTEMYHLVLSNGGNLVWAEGASGQVTVTFDEKAIAILMRMRSWIQNGWVSVDDSQHDAERCRGAPRMKFGRCWFANGGLPILMTSTFVVGYLHDEGISERILFSDVPSDESGSYKAQVWADLLASGTGTQDAQALILDLMQKNPYSTASKPALDSMVDDWKEMHTSNEFIARLYDRDVEDTNIFQNDFRSWVGEAEDAVSATVSTSFNLSTWSHTYTPYERTHRYFEQIALAQASPAIP